jgi:DNA repair exonuclease SbcCD ATPase subunit
MSGTQEAGATLQDAITVAFDPNAPATPPAEGYGGFTGAEAPRALQNRPQAAPDPQADVQAQIAAAQEQARREEKEKLYPRLSESEKRIQEMQAQLEAVTKEREAAAEAERQRAEEVAAAERARREEEMGAKDLVKEVEARFQQQLASERDERERLAALLDREREVSQLTEWRSQRLAAEDVRDQVAPTLLRFIGGNTPEEIEASIEQVKLASQETLAQIQSAQQAQWQAMPGVSSRAPAMGPIEQQPGQRSYSPQEIQAMSIAEYQRIRPQLLDAASKARYAQQG